MAKRAESAEAAPVAAKPETIRVRGRSVPMPGIGSEARDPQGNMLEPPGRYEMGHWWPPNRDVEHDIPIEDVLAFEKIEEQREQHGHPSPVIVDYPGKPAKHVKSDPQGTEELFLQVRSLSQQLADARIEISVVATTAHSRATDEVNRMRDQYDQRILGLEAENRELRAIVKSFNPFLPLPPTLEERERMAAEERRARQ